MANKTISVLYKFRGDSLANLEAKNAVYGVNEPIVVLVPADAEAGTKAATLLKLGDGTTAFNDLPYVTALAGDVPEWAKAATKPEYEASEIKNIDTYIAGKVQDTDTQYKLEQDEENPHVLIFSAKALDDENYTEVVRITTADTVYDDTALKDRIGTVETAIDTLVGDDTSKSARTIANEELAKQLIPENAQESLDTLEELAAWLQEHPDDVAAINKAIADLTALVGTLPEGITSTNVVDYIKEYADSVTANKVDKEDCKGLSANDFTDEDKSKLDDIQEGATKVEASETNGNVKIDGTETEVYVLPDTVLHDTDIIVLDGGNA